MSDEAPSPIWRLIRDRELHFICPQCGGSFYGTSYVSTERETGYCETPLCDFKWPRSEDGEHFYVMIKANDYITSRGKR